VSSIAKVWTCAKKAYNIAFAWVVFVRQWHVRKKSNLRLKVLGDRIVIFSRLHSGSVRATKKTKMLCPVDVCDLDNPVHSVDIRTTWENCFFYDALYGLAPYWFIRTFRGRRWLWCFPLGFRASVNIQKLHLSTHFHVICTKIGASCAELGNVII